MRNEFDSRDPNDREDRALGLILGVSALKTGDSISYRVPASLEAKVKRLARQIGVGRQMIGVPNPSSNRVVTVGALVNGVGNDPAVRGFLRAACREIRQMTALYRAESNASWQLLDFDVGSRKYSTLEIGHFAIERLETLVSLLVSQTSVRVPVVAIEEAAHSTLDSIEDAFLLHEPGWLGRWQLARQKL